MQIIGVHWLRTFYLRISLHSERNWYSWLADVCWLQFVDLLIQTATAHQPSYWIPHPQLPKVAHADSSMAYARCSGGIRSASISLKRVCGANIFLYIQPAFSREGILPRPSDEIQLQFYDFLLIPWHLRSPFLAPFQLHHKLGVCTDAAAFAWVEAKQARLISRKWWWWNDSARR